ncbi:MAG: ABC transporter ATP-binding protein [Peptococcaceae bacterium]|nr:ABC transporter ATP-binding protein [Peptococcaceae bacterium]
MNQMCLAEMRGITKRFPGVVANDAVDLKLYPGEIHALLGENGSGKSTLMSILAGLYRPDEGEIFIDGASQVFRSPRDAIRAGIGMVHQHFKLVDTFTVAQNIVLGDRRTPFITRMGRIEEQIARLSQRYGLQINPRAKIWQLSVGERQRVEIVKMLYRGCEILILDEPTAVLTPQEARDLFRNLREMAERGRAVVVITHKLNEVMEIADRVTVLRGGKQVGTMVRGEFTKRDLACAMVGRDVLSRIQRKSVAKGPPVLRLDKVQVLNDSGCNALQGVSLQVCAGEIFGIAGIAGNGQRELAEAVTGLRNISKGRVYVGDKDLTNAPVRRIIDEGVGYIPEDRLGTGLVPGLGVVENVILKDYRTPHLSKGPIVNRRIGVKRALDLIARFSISVTGLDAPVKLLSGGNLQRLLLAREISSGPRLIIAVYPVRGLDIAATEAVHRMLLEEREKGTAVLLISEDLDEIFKLSDRIGVLYDGNLVGVLDIEDADAERVGLMMMGGEEREAAVR